jgi:hypothetical protein
MFDQSRVRLNRARYAVVGATILFLLAAAPFAAAMGSESSISYSGDDDYDPAAGGNPETSEAAASYWSAFAASSFGGDDDYDPAAGGTPEQSVSAAAADVSSLSACDLSADEIAARNVLSSDGRFSGDDDYDWAAGGSPELSPFAFTGDSMASCDAAISSN